MRLVQRDLQLTPEFARKLSRQLVMDMRCQHLRCGKLPGESWIVIQIAWKFRDFKTCSRQLVGSTNIYDDGLSVQVLS